MSRDMKSMKELVITQRGIIINQWRGQDVYEEDGLYRSFWELTASIHPV